MRIVCFIRYEIDPYQREAFRDYAVAWARIIPRCGGDLIGYFLPHEGAHFEAWGLIGLESPANYEAYRTRLKADPEAGANFEFAREKRFIGARSGASRRPWTRPSGPLHDAAARKPKKPPRNPTCPQHKGPP